MELWVCQVCGKEGPSRDKVGDCYSWVVRVVPESVERNEAGQIVKGAAWSDPEQAP